MEKDKIKISGSIGMVHLQNKEKMKNVYIYYDDHSNKNYCMSNDSIFLYDLFENIRKEDKKHVILLEEPFVNSYSNIKFLWNDTPHIIKFRNFYKKIIKQCSEKKICYAFPVDIRLIICDVSIDELYENIDNQNYFEKNDLLVIEYFKYIMYLFGYIKYDEQIFKDCDKNIKFIKKIFDMNLDCEYYKKLKEQFDIFYNYFIKQNKNVKLFNFLKKNINRNFNYEHGYPFKNSNNYYFMNQYDNLINGIMEYYAFILITKIGSKNISVYAGYYHSNNLTYILNNYYNYEKIYQIGHTENIEKLENKEIKNCIYINKNIFNS